jgi:glycosyltransferase involved in cell wall biosynthesis
MRILVTQESDWLTRGPHQQHQLFDRLSGRGHEIRVIDYDIDWQKNQRRELIQKKEVFENQHRVLDDAKIKVIRPSILRVPILNYLSLMLTHNQEIENQICDFEPDIIVGFGIINAYLALYHAKRNKIPFVHYWIDVLHRLIPLKPMGFVGEYIENIILKNADYVLTINNALKDYVLSRGAQEDKSDVICAGIDLDRFKIKYSRDEMRAKYHYSQNDKVMLFLGYIYHFSGVKEIALSLAQDANCNAKLLVVGDGEAFDDMLYIKQNIDKYDKITLTGKLSYELVPSIINMSDICLLPAYPGEKIMQDIVPIKLYEYFAMKKPVICTKLNGVMKEFDLKNKGIFYIEHLSDFTDAFKMLNTADLVEMGNDAYKLVSELTWDKLTNEFEQLLLRLVKENE